MKAIYGAMHPVTAGNMAVSRSAHPGDHDACDAEIGRLARTLAVIAEHFPAVWDALGAAEAGEEYAARKLRYREALAAFAPLAGLEVPEVQYVRSSDSAGTGEEISALKG